MTPTAAGPVETIAPPGEASPQRERTLLRGGGTLLVLIFLISGASGLIYQVVWSRAMTLVFGSTTQGVATVLAAFMGGLCFGSWLASRFGDRLPTPLKAYGLLEGGIAILSLSVLLLMPALDAAYRVLYPVAHLSLPALTLVRFLLASLFLLPATTLMGATLPVLSAYVERRGHVPGQGASTLYAVNTVGAVAGSAAAGFWLLPAMGMTGTTLLAAAGNLAAAVAALYLSRRVEEEGHDFMVPFSHRPARRPGAIEDVSAVPPPPGALAGVAAALAVSGAGALVLEVGWTRTLSLILGSSTQAFTVMLTTFLIGLAVGSAIASRLLHRIPNPLAAFALAELGAGLMVYLGVFVFPELPYAFIRVFRATRESPAWFEIGRFALASSVMLPPTLMLGATFPLAVRCFRLASREAARPVGSLYAVNTLGAIAGSLAAGFLLVPLVGLRQTLVAGALVNLSVGAFLLAVSTSANRAYRYGLAAVIFLILPGLPIGAPPWNPLVMTSGVFQYAPHFARQFPTRREFIEYHEAHKQLFYKDGATTTITVEKRPARQDGKAGLVLTVNGKVDASSVGDMETQVLSGQLPMLTAREPRRALVIGWGSGVSVGSVLTHPGVVSVHAVELEPAVIEASRLFRDFNHDPYDDPRLRIEINDARHTLLVDDSFYDVIMSEPSNPWLAGPSRLFTREFFLLAEERLAPGGILCQWVQLYGLDLDSYRTLLRTLADVFADVVVLKGAPGDTLVMASDTPIRFDVHRIAERMRIPAVAADLRRINVGSAASLLSRFRVGGDELRTLVGPPGPLNTDDNALIEFAAPRNLYSETHLENDALLTNAPSSPLDHTDLSGLSAVEADRFPVSLAREYLTLGLEQRARADLARAGSSRPAAVAAEAAALRGDILARGAKHAEARSAWEEALRTDPSCLPALMSLGTYLLEKAEESDAAVDVLRRAVEAHPDSVEAKIKLGRALQAAGRSSEAVAVLEAAAGQDPPSPLAALIHMHWGRACMAIGDTECAVRELTRYFRDWREIAKPAESSVEAALDLGRAYLALDKGVLALEQFRVATDLAGSMAGWHRTQADEAMRRGDVAAEESNLRRAIEWNATDQRNYHGLGALLVQQERWEDALAVWSALLVRYPDDPNGLGGAVDSLIRTGRLREAAPLLKRLLDIEEDPARIAVLNDTLRKATQD